MALSRLRTDPFKRVLFRAKLISTLREHVKVMPVDVSIVACYVLYGTLISNLRLPDDSILLIVHS